MHRSRHLVMFFRCGCRSFSRSKISLTTANSDVSKKDTSGEMARAYDPGQVEAGWYEWWEAEGMFRPRPPGPPVFSMLLPPPNVTGTLHLGHALTCSVQDVLARWRRMSGDSVVWVPGSDHAGIATQAVVERHLARAGLGSREQLGRERFVREVWRWRHEKGGVITRQLRQLGSSLDWSREFFTLDQRQSLAVREAFVRLHDAGLVQRRAGLVSWSCALRSAIADVEVEWRELPGPAMLNVPGHERPVQFGVLTHVALPLVAGGGELVVATTRVETMLGDVAVAVHPGDERFSGLVGQRVVHPLLEGVSLPVIADDFVDPLFGTGAVKVTPAHDSADHAVGLRHGLDSPGVFTEDGRIDPRWTEFAGLPRFEARERMTARLAQLGALRGTSALGPSRVPLCSRSGDVVELLLRPQWFIRCKEMARKAEEALEDGSLVIDPPAFHKVWHDWLGNVRDWCVSRQLWWGHRVPAYLCSSPDGREVWVAARDLPEARARAEAQLGTSQVAVRQDEDVLDTWFSSALLPLSALGWPENDLQGDPESDLARFWPLSVMETGHDILFFWVARMTMLGTQLAGRLPFKKVLLHGIICDAHGRKMSKSLGNVIHPEDVVHGTSLQTLLERARQNHDQRGAVGELDRALSAQRAAFPQGVPQCGTDALRFTLCSHNLKVHSVTFDMSECLTNRLFCNKVWQAARFVLAAAGTADPGDLDLGGREELGLMERWVLSRQAEAVRKVGEALENADLHLATAAIKGFLYGEFCDVYVETSKPTLKNPATALSATRTLVACLGTSVRLLAPFMPFLSEELYQRLPLRTKDSVHLEQFPSTPQWAEWRDERAEEQVQMLLVAVEAVRRLKKASKVTKQRALVRLEVSGAGEEVYLEGRGAMQTLAACFELEVVREAPPPPSTSEVVSPNCTVHLLGQSDEGGGAALRRERLVREVSKLRAVTSAPGYLTKAPPQVQRGHQQKLERLEAELAKVEQRDQSGTR